MKWRRRSRLLVSQSVRAVRLSLLCLLLIPPAAPSTATAVHGTSFDYLYIESNEGGSSGGHTAIRFGGDVYHFQAEDGMLVLRRDPATEFLYSYALLGNRTIHSTRVSVSEATFQTLLARFSERHRAQEAQIEVAKALRADRRFLEQLHHAKDRRTASAETPDLPILGLGYFERAPVGIQMPLESPHVEPRSETLRALREAILKAHGGAFFSTRREGLVDAMRSLAGEDPTNWTVETASSAYDHPTFALSYSRRWRNLFSGLAALDVLEEARPLAKENYHAPRHDSFSFDDEEVRAYTRFAAALSSQLIQLIDSRRSDWGETLLIGMARLSALEKSIQTGRLVFLDTYPENPETLDQARLTRRSETWSVMQRENQSQLEASRTYFRDHDEAKELAFERVEERSNRYFEILRATELKAPMRVARGHLIPSRAAPSSVAGSLGLHIKVEPSDIDRARERERHFDHQLSQLHRYDLIAQNCATALFETINDSFGGSVETSKRRLGGHIRDRLSLAFIPFVSSRQVQARYSVVSTEIIPSYRLGRLEDMREQEPALRVAFRESNTLTATTYEGSSADSFFIFFTDETLLLRPLFGVINLTAALGQIVLGIVTAPVDHGHNMVRGLRGAFVSLPELAFSNIRKGSNDWIPPDHRNISPRSPSEGPPR